MVSGISEALAPQRTEQCAPGFVFVEFMSCGFRCSIFSSFTYGSVHMPPGGVFLTIPTFQSAPSTGPAVSFASVDVQSTTGVNTSNSISRISGGMGTYTVSSMTSPLVNWSPSLSSQILSSRPLSIQKSLFAL